MSANPHIVSTEQLRELSGKRSRTAIRRWASAHKTDAMTAHYNHELQTVDPAGRK